MLWYYKIGEWFLEKHRQNFPFKDLWEVPLVLRRLEWQNEAKITSNPLPPDWQFNPRGESCSAQSHHLAWPVWLGPWGVGQPGLTLNSLSYSCQTLILVVQSAFRGSIFLLLVNMNFFFSKNLTPGARIITQEKSGLWWKWWVNGGGGRVPLLRENISFLWSANFETVMVSPFLPPVSLPGSSFHLELSRL